MGAAEKTTSNICPSCGQRVPVRFCLTCDLIRCSDGRLIEGMMPLMACSRTARPQRRCPRVHFPLRGGSRKERDTQQNDPAQEWGDRRSRWHRRKIRSVGRERLRKFRRLDLEKGVFKLKSEKDLSLKRCGNDVIAVSLIHIVRRCRCSRSTLIGRARTRLRLRSRHSNNGFGLRGIGSARDPVYQPRSRTSAPDLVQCA